jgi:hypothetical protein
MGIIHDQRPRDWAYIARFPQEDLPTIQAMIAEINETHNGEILECFNEQLEQRVQHNDPAVVKSNDLMTNPGLQQCLNIILGTSSTRWRYMGTGVGTSTPTVIDTTLQTPHVRRQDMANGVGGWMEAVGMKLFFGAIVDQTLTSTVDETGVFNASSAGTMLNRNQYLPNALSRNLLFGPGAYDKVFIISSVVEFCPMA